jgi:hypothetical protein
MSKEQKLEEHARDASNRSKKLYSVISKTLRSEIIRKIVSEKRSYPEVAMEHDILPSTCKSIVATFLKDGRIGKKERRIRKMTKVSTYYDIVINLLNPCESKVNFETSVENIVEPSS